MTAKLRLLIIDPQVDFCDGPCNGALPVPGADADMMRLAAMVDRLSAHIDAIDVTLDSHHTVDIAHPAWWMDRSGQEPPPFTSITTADAEAGRWTPRNPAWRQRSLDYVRALEARGKYVLCIWPVHCLIGSPGHAVHPTLFAALQRWERQSMGSIDFVMKGGNKFTEHYSAVQAEVPDPADPSTQLNTALIDRVRESDMVLIAGEALSHCVKSTVTDIADQIGARHLRKLVFLEDCSSPVPGDQNEALGLAFAADLHTRGIRISRSATVTL